MRTYRALAAAAFACLAISATPALAEEGVTNFVSAPSFKPATLTVNRSAKGQAPGYVFIAMFQNKFFTTPLVGNGGPMILDNKAHYVWLKNASKIAPDTLNLQVQRYQGKPVLTYWDGTVQNTGEMVGTWHVLNDRYKEIAKISSADGWDPSGHEFFITKAGHALITGYKHVPHRDLSSVGGGTDQTLLDSGVLDYDIKTGKLVNAWSADAHIPMSDGYPPANPNSPVAYDPWHINSIDVAADGSWLVSMRNAWTVYKINPTTGAIDWRIGGKHSDFTVPDNVAFAFQHDARWRNGGKQISIFDNDCCALQPQPSGPPKAAPPVHGSQSRGLLMNIDENAKTVSLATDRKLYTLISGTQGNFQMLTGGNAFLGWGQQPFFSEFSKTGKLLLSVRYPDQNESYRAYRYQWVGHPSGHPAVAARPQGSKTRVYMSWNGATDVKAWRIWTGKSSRKLTVAAKRITRNGFETAKTVKGGGPIVKVQALNAKGKVIATSRAVHRENTSANEPAPSY